MLDTNFSESLDAANFFLNVYAIYSTYIYYIYYVPCFSLLSIIKRKKVSKNRNNSSSRFKFWLFNAIILIHFGKHLLVLCPPHQFDMDFLPSELIFRIARNSDRYVTACWFTLHGMLTRATIQIQIQFRCGHQERLPWTVFIWTVLSEPRIVASLHKHHTICSYISQAAQLFRQHMVCIVYHSKYSHCPIIHIWIFCSIVLFSVLFLRRDLHQSAEIVLQQWKILPKERFWN